MVLYLPGNFQVFKEDMALWVALINNKRSNNSQYNNAQSMYTIYIYIYIYIYIFAWHNQTDDRWYIQNSHIFYK